MAQQDSQAIIDLSNQWKAKKTAGASQSELDALHAQAEALRAKQGYSGGADGSQNIALSSVPASNPMFTSQQAQNDVYAASKPTVTPVIGGNTIPDTSVVPPPAPPPAASTTPTPQPDYIAQLKTAQLSSRLSALDKAKNNALSSLKDQESAVEPAYYGKRNQAAAASELGQMNFAQFQASRGMNGNAGAMPEIYRNNALQTNIGNLNQQEQAQFDKINSDRTAIKNNYESDVAAANADVESQAMQNYITQMNADKAYELNKAGLTGKLDGQDTLAAKDSAFNQGIATAGLTGTYNGQSTLAKQQMDTSKDQWQQSFDFNKDQAAVDNAWKVVESTGKVDANTAKVLGIDEGTSTLEARQMDISNAWNKVNSMGTVDAQTSKILNIPVGTSTLQAQEFEWSKNKDNPAVKAQILGNDYQQLQNDMASLEKANLPDKLKAELAQVQAQTKAALDNSSARVANAQIAQINAQTKQIKAEAAAALTASKINTGTTNTVDDYASTINSIYVTKANPATRTKASIDTDGIKSYLDSLLTSLPDTPQNNAMIDQLAARYGIK